MNPQGTSLFNPAYVQNITSEIASLNTCAELNAVVQKVMASLQAEQQAMMAQLQNLAPIAALLNPPVSPPQAVTWVENFITNVLTPQYKPYLNYISQLQQLEQAGVALASAISQAANNLTSCNISVPSLSDLPSAPVAGQTWYDIPSGQSLTFDGSNWNPSPALPALPYAPGLDPVTQEIWNTANAALARANTVASSAAMANEQAGGASATVNAVTSALVGAALNGFKTTANTIAATAVSAAVANAFSQTGQAQAAAILAANAALLGAITSAANSANTYAAYALGNAVIANTNAGAAATYALAAANAVSTGQGYANAAALSASQAASFSNAASAQAFTAAQSSLSANTAAASAQSYSNSSAAAASNAASAASAVAVQYTSVSANVANVQAQVSSNATALATLSGQTYSTYTLTAGSGNNISGMQLLSASGPTSISSVIFNANSFQIWDGTNTNNLFSVTAGTNQLANVAINGSLLVNGTVTANAMNVATLGAISANIGTVTAGLLQSNSGLNYYNLNAGQIVFNTGTVMKVNGTGFGMNSDLIEWFGPSIPIANCTKTNATYYLGIDGSAYFGGSLTAGALTTSASTSSTAANATVTTAVFGSRGNTIVVTLSLGYQASHNTTYSDTSGGISSFNSACASFGVSSPGAGNMFRTGPNQVAANTTVQLYRSINNSAFSLVATLNTNSAWSASGIEPINGSDPGYIDETENISASLTYTDPTLSTDNRQYYATMTGRNVYFSGLTPTQTISIQCVEQ